MAYKRKYFKKSNGKVNNKETVVDGVKVKSELEAYMYKLLKEEGMEFGYESKRYTLVEPFTYKGETWEKSKTQKDLSNKKVSRAITYTPDFVDKKERWIIETKGWENESFPLRWKLFKRKMNTMKEPPLIFKPNNKQNCEQVILILKGKGF